MPGFTKLFDRLLEPIKARIQPNDPVTKTMEAMFAEEIKCILNHEWPPPSDGCNPSDVPDVSEDVPELEKFEPIPGVLSAEIQRLMDIQRLMGEAERLHGKRNEENNHANPIQDHPGQTDTVTTSREEAVRIHAHDVPPPGGDSGTIAGLPPPGGGAGIVAEPAPDPLFALCLSGGGIRSAAFCLGVVQALARSGVLERFHYLSTVSGGGYTGSLIWRLIHDLRGVRPAQSALAKPDATPDIGSRWNWLSNLRDYTSYLAPSGGIASVDIWAAIVLWARNTAVNWTLFLPGLMAFALLPQLFLQVLKSGLVDWVWIVCGVACLLLAVVIGSLWLPAHHRPAEQATTSSGWVTSCITLPLVVGWAFATVAWFAHSLSVGSTRGLSVGSTGAIWEIPSVALALYLVGYALAWWVAARFRKAVDRQTFGRNRFRWLIASLADAASLALAIYLVGSHLVGSNLVVCRPLDMDDMVYLAVFGPTVVVSTHLVHAAVYAVIRHEGPTSWLDREWIARLSATEAMYALLWSGFSLAALQVPNWVRPLTTIHAGTAGISPAMGPLALLFSGPLAALLGRSAKTLAGTASVQRTWRQILPGVLAFGLAAIFLITLVALCSEFGWRLVALIESAVSGLIESAVSFVWTGRVPSWDALRPSHWYSLLLGIAARVPPWDALRPPHWYSLLLGFAALFGVSVWLGSWININRFSLHELYRNRLVRAFSGSARKPGRQPDGFTRFDEKDGMQMKDIITRVRGA